MLALSPRRQRLVGGLAAVVLVLATVVVVRILAGRRR